MYLFAATSQGYVYPPGANSKDDAPLTAPTIFDSLTNAGVSWKIYVTDNKICERARLKTTTRSNWLLHLPDTVCEVLPRQIRCLQMLYRQANF